MSGEKRSEAGPEHGGLGQADHDAVFGAVCPLVGYDGTQTLLVFIFGGNTAMPFPDRELPCLIRIESSLSGSWSNSPSSVEICCGRSFLPAFEKLFPVEMVNTPVELLKHVLIRFVNTMPDARYASAHRCESQSSPAGSGRGESPVT